MDLKTLEHLEDKVKKGRELVTQIKQLKQTIERLEKLEIQEIQFVDQVRVWAICENRAVPAMVKACIQAAKEEIARLEQELAEL